MKTGNLECGGKALRDAAFVGEPNGPEESKAASPKALPPNSKAVFSSLQGLALI